MSPTRIAVMVAGHVGATFAYARLLSGLAAEIVLIDDYSRIGDVYLRLPAVVDRSGVKRVLRLELSPEEVAGLRRSAEALKASRASLDT